MNKYFCFNCSHVWTDLDHDGCPSCENKDYVVNETELDGWANPDAAWDDDGHFEGDFPQNNHDNSISE